jgi:hypothetical protein
MLIDQVCDFLLPAADTHSVAEVRLGLGYTAVELDDGRCGLAYTFRDELAEGCGVMSGAGTLAGRRAAELAQWAKSTDLLASGVGLATLNALIEAPPTTKDADLLAELKVTPDDIVGMVGYFGPFIGPIRSRSKALHVFERRREEGSGILSESAAAEIRPQCQVVVLTATTLLNRTLDDLLACCRSAREVAIVGPSTPLLPAVFARWGVTLLSGVQVVDGQRVLRVISEGGGTRQFGSSVHKLTLRCGH